LPVWLEILLVGVAGIAPVLWMQWQSPFYIFSLVAVALKPEQLTENQRKLLTLFKSQRNRFLAVGAAILTCVVLQKLYYLAPIAASIAPFSSNTRLLGLLLAAIAFLGANLFLQVPVSVLSVMLTGDAAFAATSPYAIEQIRQDFSLLGFLVNQILPPLVVEPVKPIPVTSSETAGVSFSPDVNLSGSSLSDVTSTTAEALSSTNDSTELDDIWGASEAVTPPFEANDLTVPAPVVEAGVDQPTEKPDLDSVDAKTEEVKTEEDIL